MKLLLYLVDITSKNPFLLKENSKLFPVRVLDRPIYLLRWKVSDKLSGQIPHLDSQTPCFCLIVTTCFDYINKISHFSPFRMLRPWANALYSENNLLCRLISHVMPLHQLASFAVLDKLRWKVPQPDGPHWSRRRVSDVRVYQGARNYNVMFWYCNWIEIMLDERETEELRGARTEVQVTQRGDSWTEEQRRFLKKRLRYRQEQWWWW